MCRRQVVSILDLASMIADLLDFELKPIFMPRRPLEIEAAFCSSDKARSLLGYQTTYQLRDGLRRNDRLDPRQGTGAIPLLVRD